MKKYRHTLAHCPRCGMDSGERRMTGTEPPRYCVWCTSCGHRTGFKYSMNAATRAWEKEGTDNG